MLLLVITLFLVLFEVSNEQILDTKDLILSRQKRTLIWPEFINWFQLIVGIGLPVELKDHSITVGTVAKAYYLLPNNSNYFTNPPIQFTRRKRSATRWIIYGLIEQFLERFKYGDGKACLLRSICETASAPFEKRTGILSEIVHAILTPSSTRETLDSHLDTEYHAAEKLGKETVNCAMLFPECSINLVQQFSRFLT